MECKSKVFNEVYNFDIESCGIYHVYKEGYNGYLSKTEFDENFAIPNKTKSIELDRNYMSIEELELLSKLIKRCADTYHGCEFRERICDYEITCLQNASSTINQQLEEMYQEGFTIKDLIKGGEN